jgi:hypothetical protein
VHVPTPVKCTVVPLTVQTSLDPTALNVTARPELAVALSAAVAPMIAGLGATAGNVIVWACWVGALASSAKPRSPPKKLAYHDPPPSYEPLGWLPRC